MRYDRVSVEVEILKREVSGIYKVGHLSSLEQIGS